MARRKSNAARKQEAPVESNEQSFPTTEQLVADGFTTKSSRIRELHRLGMPTGDIARQETNGLYQHAYNVIKRPLKTQSSAAAPAEASEAETESGE